MSQVTDFSYDMGSNCTIEDKGMIEVTKFLNSFSSTIHVENLQNDKMCQDADIDLLWVKRKDLKFSTVTVEVKICVPHTTRNFFLEIISNESKLTPGGVVYSFADYFCYLFYDRKELYLIPARPLRLWLIQNWDKLKTVKTQTRIGNSFYVTKGKMVEEAAILNIIGMQKHILNYDIDQSKPKALT